MRVGKWKMKLRSVISIRWKLPLPRLVIHEKYERGVKWILRTLAAFGIVSSVIAFSTWHYSLTFALLVFAFEQFFERAIFKYTVIYIQPMPDFRYDPKQWLGMAFAFHMKSC